MSKYRKIDPRIWNDEKFRRLSDQGKLVFFFLLTHPHMTAIGAMRATSEGLAAELKWPADVMRDAMSDAISKGMVDANTEASYIGLPNFLRYNEPEGPNSVMKAWRSALDLIPECPEKRRLAHHLFSYLSEQSEKFKNQLIDHPIWDAIRHAMSDPSDIQEQEQDIGTGAVVNPPLPPRKRGGSATPASADFEKFWQAYPTKKNRGRAEKAWAKIKPDAGLVEAILVAINQAKAGADWLRDGGKYIPNPATWLNDKCWLDETRLAAYSEAEAAVIAAYNARLMPKGWPEAVMAPYSAERAAAIREFLGFSDKPDWITAYFEFVAGFLEPRAGLGFEWVIRQETFLRCREGNFASLKVAA
jgi:hypothetical protein